MTNAIDRGTIVLAKDPFSSNGKRPFCIISDSSYPFYPYGHLGLPVTTRDKSNTFEIHEYDIEEVYEELHVTPSYINPYSPSQVNEWEKKIVVLSDGFCDILAEKVTDAIGIKE